MNYLTMNWYKKANTEDEEDLVAVMQEMFPPINSNDYYYTIFNGDMRNDTVFNGISKRLKELNVKAEYSDYNSAWRIYRVNTKLLDLLPEIGKGNGKLLPFTHGGGSRLYPLKYFGDKLENIEQLKWITA